LQIGWQLTLAALLLVSPLDTYAQAQETLRLADLIAGVRSDNPELRAARELARAAAAAPRRERAYDDPTFSYESWNFPNSFALDRADNNIFRLSQKVPFPGKRSLAGRIAEHEAERVADLAASVELDVILAAKRAFFALWSAHENLRIYEREKQLLQRFAHIAEQNYAVGKVLQTDVLRAQVEITGIGHRVNTAQLTIDTAGAELNALLNREPNRDVGIPEGQDPPQLDLNPIALIELALKKRPEMSAQRASIAREQRALDLAERQYWPDFEFSLSRFVNEGTEDGFGAMASITVPLAYRSKYAAGVTEAEARLAAAKAETLQVESQIRREVQQAFAEAQTALAHYALFVTTHIPQAEQVLRVTESGYQAGSASFLDLIDTARVIESVHLEHVAAQAEFAMAHADLERAVGSDLSVPAGDAGHE
jgi:outer membrane protein TolC